MVIPWHAAERLSTETLQQSLNIGLEYQCCHDPLSLRQLAIAHSWEPCSDTRMQLIYIRFCFSSLLGCIYVVKQGLSIPSDTINVGSDGIGSFGKRLTWRRRQHGLVGWEMTVNSGPFSQLPAETNTNDYPAIVSKEATRHSLMLTKSYALWSSLSGGFWETTVLFVAISFSFLFCLKYPWTFTPVGYYRMFSYYSYVSDLTIATKCSRFMPGLLALVSASLSNDEIRKPAAFPEYPPWETTHKVRITHTHTHTHTTCDNFKQTMIQNPGAQSEWRPRTHAQPPSRPVYCTQIKRTDSALSMWRKEKK